jgi:hypothetical protein
MVVVTDSIKETIPLKVGADSTPETSRVSTIPQTRNSFQNNMGVMNKSLSRAFEELLTYFTVIRGVNYILSKSLQTHCYYSIEFLKCAHAQYNASSALIFASLQHNFSKSGL